MSSSLVSFVLICIVFIHSATAQDSSNNKALDSKANGYVMSMDSIPNYNGYKNKELDSKDSEYEMRSILNGDKNKHLDYNQNDKKDKNGKNYRVDPYNPYQREYRADPYNPYQREYRADDGCNLNLCVDTGRDVAEEPWDSNTPISRLYSKRSCYIESGEVIDETNNYFDSECNGPTAAMGGSIAIADGSDPCCNEQIVKSMLPLLPDGIKIGEIYAIKSVSSGAYYNGRDPKNTRPILTNSDDPRGNKYLHWTIEQTNIGYAIKSVSSNRYLDGRTPECCNLPLMRTRDPSDDPLLNWVFSETNGGFVAVQSISSNKFLDGRPNQYYPLLRSSSGDPLDDEYLEWMFELQFELCCAAGEEFEVYDELCYPVCRDGWVGRAAFCWFANGGINGYHRGDGHPPNQSC